MKFVTFNIRCDYGQDGDNRFECRKPLILKKIQKEQPDILCFQEVLPHVAQWIKDNLTDYIVVGCGRDAQLRGEQMTVAFRKARFNLMEMQSYWLSPTPHVPGSRYAEQSWCPRTATELVLRDVDTGKVFRVVNTHLDHEGTLARQLGLKQILRHLESLDFFPDAPVILMGDFNAPPDSEEMQAFGQYPGYTNATADMGATFHGFMTARTQEQIDYIFIKGGIRAVSAVKWMDAVDGVCLSDHYPVCVQALLE